MFRFNTPCLSLPWRTKEETPKQSPRCDFYNILLAITTLLAGLTTAPLAAQEDPTTARGFEADQVYQFGNLDHVGIFNGSLLLTLASC